MLTWQSKRGSFESTAMPHVDAVYRFALHLCGNEPDAEDLVQDCFAQAFRKFHQFRRGSNCRAWLFRIARNALIDRLRRARREPRATDLQGLPARLEPEAPEPSGDPLEGLAGWRALATQEEEVFFDLFGDEVNRILAELPREFRLSVVLCDVEGFTYQEIAAVLDCPVGTVRSRISRARQHLKERLHEYAQGLGYARDEGR